MLQTTKVRLIEWGILFIVCFILIAVFGSNSSIFYQDYSGDYSVFVMMGRGWMNDVIPYRDLFDHKGPLVYLIQAAGQSICEGKCGVFMIETIFYWSYLILLREIGRALKCSRVIVYLSIIFSLIYLCICINGGNTTEEWSLPFVILPVYLAVLYYNGSYDKLWVLAFISGICFGCIAMIRLNNSSIILGLAVGMSFYLIRNKKYVTLLNCIGIFILGILTVTLPFILYFWSVRALDDFLYCNFVFNFAYKAKWNGGFSFVNTLDNLTYLYPSIILPIICWIQRKRFTNAMMVSFAAMGIITCMVFITGANYGHYFLMTMPIASFCILMTQGMTKLTQGIALLFSIIPLLIIHTGSALNNLRSFKAVILGYGNNQFINMSHDVKKIVPHEDLDSIYIKGTFAITPMLELNRLPIGKYTFLQDRISQIDSVVKKDISDSFIQANPKWIISTSTIDSVYYINGSNYELIRQNTTEFQWYIYRRR